MQVVKRIFQLLLFFFHLLVLYFLLVIIGLFWPRNANESINSLGIPLIVHGDGFHTELYLPIEDSTIHHNWFSFFKDTLILKEQRHKKYINVGLAEEDWSIAGINDQTSVLMAIETLLWPLNKSIMHVQFMDTVHTLSHHFTEARMLNITQYEQLIAFIKSGFVLENGRPVVRSYEGYYGFDYFFLSNRRYHAFNTCNQWSADALNAGKNRNPVFAPFGWSIAYQVRK